MTYDEHHDADEAREIRVTFASIVGSIAASIIASALALLILAGILMARGEL